MLLARLKNQPRVTYNQRIEAYLNLHFALILNSIYIFFKGICLDKSLIPIQTQILNDEDYILAIQSFVKPSVFKRFRSIETSQDWYSNGNYSDEIIFIPNKNIIICGFSWYAAKYTDKYEMRYIIKIDDTIVEKETIVATGWEDKYYFRRELNGKYDASSGSKIHITCWISENLQSDSNIWGFKYNP